VVAYPDVMNYVANIVRYEPGNITPGPVPYGNVLAINDNRKLHRILDAEFGMATEVIHTGGKRPQYAAREQRADGTNVLAVGPSEVITYERNRNTNDELRAWGVKVHTIGGSELVRGLGGPRCMTLPLVRDEVGL
jgi:arginine deiminase